MRAAGQYNDALAQRRTRLGKLLPAHLRRVMTVSMDADDKHLILRARAGDSRAFDALVGRYGRVVLSVARTIVARREDADDVAQEAFLRLYRSLGRIDVDRPLEGWIVTLTVNAARTVATRSASRREDALEDLSPPTTPNDGPHAPIEAADVRRAVLSAAGELTERERLVFLLRDVQGLDAATVGEALGITAVTVRRLSGNARAKVIEWLRRHRPEFLLGRPGAATVDPEECGEKSPPL